MPWCRKVSLAFGFSLLGTVLVGCGSGSPTASDSQESADSQTVTAAREKSAREAKHPVVLMRTSLGEITIELDGESAPLTVANFLAYADRGQYDKSIFHQIEKDFVVLGGGYTPQLVEHPARPAVRNEADNGLKNLRGTIAMARRPDVIDSATNQFYFNLADNSALDYQGRTAKEYGYCVFGKIVDGLDVVEKIGQIEVRQAPQFDKLPVETVLIQSVRRLR